MKRSKEEKELFQKYKSQIRKEVLELPKLGVGSAKFKKIQKETDDLAELIKEKYGTTYDQFEKIIKKVTTATMKEALASPSAEFDPQKEFAQTNKEFDDFVEQNSMPLAKRTIHPKTKIKERAESVRKLQREAVSLTRQLLHLEREQGYTTHHYVNPAWLTPSAREKHIGKESRRQAIREIIGEGAWEEVRMQNMRDSYNEAVKLLKGRKPLLKALIKV